MDIQGGIPGFAAISKKDVVDIFHRSDPGVNLTFSVVSFQPIRRRVRNFMNA